MQAYRAGRRLQTQACLDDRLKALFSCALKDGVVRSLGVHRNLRLKSNADKHVWPFLTWHRENIFVTTM